MLDENGVPLPLPHWAVIVKPGDRVILGLDRHINQARMQSLKDALVARMPDVDFTIIAGLQTVAIEHAEPAE